MTQSLRDYMSDLDNIKDKWNLNVVNPYHLAYSAAFKSFKDTLSAQQKLDELKADLAFAALGIVGGGILTAAFGKAGVVHAAKEIVVDTIAQKNMQRAIGLSRMLESRPTASFILGEMAEALAAKTASHAQQKAKAAMGNFDASTYAPEPDQVKTTMQQYVLHAKTKAYDWAVALRDNRNTEDSIKEAIVPVLRVQHFCLPPQTSIDDGHLAKYIELTMWMTYVLSTDYQVTQKVKVDSTYATMTQGTRTSIRHMPSAEQYPKNSSKRTESGGTATTEITTIQYDKVGSKIQTAIDTLYRWKFGSDFFEGRNDAEEMVKAEKALQTIAPLTFDRIQTLSRN